MIRVQRYFCRERAYIQFCSSESFFPFLMFPYVLHHLVQKFPKIKKAVTKLLSLSFFLTIYIINGNRWEFVRAQIGAADLYLGCMLESLRELKKISYSPRSWYNQSDCFPNLSNLWPRLRATNLNILLFGLDNNLLWRVIFMDFRIFSSIPFLYSKQMPVASLYSKLWPSKMSPDIVKYVPLWGCVCKISFSWEPLPLNEDGCCSMWFKLFTPDSSKLSVSSKHLLGSKSAVQI